MNSRKALARLSVWGLPILMLAASATSGGAGQKSPAKGFYLEVPYVRQEENYCGPAVLAMLLRYWNHPADHRELAGRFQPFPKKGLSGLELKKLAASEGFQTYSFAGDTPEMLDHLRQGRPLITVIDPSVLTTNNHYVVLVGWDESRKEWIVHDSGEGTLSAAAGRGDGAAALAAGILDASGSPRDSILSRLRQQPQPRLTTMSGVCSGMSGRRRFPSASSCRYC